MNTTLDARRHRWPATLCVVALLAGVAASPTADAADVRPIAEIMSLTDAELRGLPQATIHGVVTFREEHGRLLFLQDETAGIYAAFPRDRPDARLPDDVQVGVAVEVEGFIGPGGFAPHIKIERVRAKGPAALPKPRPFDATRFFVGADNGSLVEVTGVVRSVREERFMWRIIAAHESMQFQVECRKSAMPADFGRWCESLIDGVVNFRGIAVVSFNARGESLAPRLFVSRRDWIEPVTRPEHGPFDAPRVAIDAVARYRSDPLDDHTIRTEGTVVHAVPGEVIYLQEGHHGLRVLTRAVEPFKPGDRVEVAGFVDRSGTVAGLSEAVVRLVSHGEPPLPIDIAPDEVAKIHARSADTYVIADPGDFEGCLVRFPATLLERKPGKSGDLLVLAAGETSVTARMTAADLDSLGGLEPGTRLSISGVLHVIPEPRTLKWPLTAPTRMELAPRSAADITILSRPSWWTPRRLAWALGLGAAMLAATVAWVIALRRQVGRQLRVIEASLEEKAITEERRRIAREFHDSLEQDMANVALQLDAAAGFAEGEVRDLLEEQRMLVARMQRETRQFVWDLRDPAPAGWGFADLLAAQCREQGARAAVPVELHVDGPVVEPPRVARYHLLKIAGEAVANAIRHAAATRVTVRLAGGPSGLTITVHDDGRGFDLEKSEWREGHFGIRGMRERAQRIGAGFAIDTSPGAGTTVSIGLDAAGGQTGRGVSLLTMSQRGGDG